MWEAESDRDYAEACGHNPQGPRPMVPVPCRRCGRPLLYHEADARTCLPACPATALPMRRTA